ncbi:MAG: SDR family oxidoreductase [Chloroflexi bacterium]|nr:SDR family oxidoreductase [Chloroflexota bacterium]
MAQQSLAGKVAVITGAGRGIGREIALRLATEKAHVVLAARTRTEIEAVASEVRALGGTALAAPTDVGYGAAVDALFRQATEAFGQVDILVNNAGTYPMGAVADITEEAWDAAMRVNLKSFYLCSRAALTTGKMLERRSGHIISIASIMVRREAPNLAIHVSFKHGVLGFSESLRRELSPLNIRVSLVCPGPVDTALLQSPEAQAMVHRRERWIQPADVADLVLYIARLPENINIGEAHITAT